MGHLAFGLLFVLPAWFVWNDRASVVFVFSFLGFLAGGLSHVFADMLSAPDISTPIEPLWPFVDGSWGIDLVWYNVSWINVGFLTVALFKRVRRMSDVTY